MGRWGRWNKNNRSHVPSMLPDILNDAGGNIDATKASPSPIGGNIVEERSINSGTATHDITGRHQTAPLGARLGASRHDLIHRANIRGDDKDRFE